MREVVENELKNRFPNAKKVLDIGGARGLCSFATHVIDILSYQEAKDIWGPYFKDVSIPPENWIAHDICDRAPFPFADNYFDLVVCSHVLEDIRDPIHVSSEISRIGKAGYIETPTPLLELTRGMDPQGKAYVGYCHHRWLVENQDGELVFSFKPHFLHSSRRFHFPNRFAKKWRRQGREFTQLFWEDNFKAEERVMVSRKMMEKIIESIIKAERGDLLEMRIARFSNQIFQLGKNWTDKLGVQDQLRPIYSRIRNLF